MTWIKGVAGVLVGIVALFFVVGLFLPGKYSVSRSVTIDAGPEQIHRLVGDLGRWRKWTPWTELDPSVRTTLGDVTTGIGASQYWAGKSGSGELRFTESEPAAGVVYDMSFDRGKYVSTGAIRYEADDGGTRVTWEMIGENDGVIGRYFGLMMESMVGPSFEQGLSRLKHAAERLPKTVPREEPVIEASPEESGA